jgi:hypothetical protein
MRGFGSPRTSNAGTDFSHGGSGGRDGDGSTQIAATSPTYGVRTSSSKNAWQNRQRLLK